VRTALRLDRRDRGHQRYADGATTTAKPALLKALPPLVLLLPGLICIVSSLEQVKLLTQRNAVHFGGDRGAIRFEANKLAAARFWRTLRTTGAALGSDAAGDLEGLVRCYHRAEINRSVDDGAL